MGVFLMRSQAPQMSRNWDQVGVQHDELFTGDVLLTVHAHGPLLQSS
jgi:hypothetical protein